eukprot:4681317-Prorocentrum_lima.AAC.1
MFVADKRHVRLAPRFIQTAKSVSMPEVRHVEGDRQFRANRILHDELAERLNSEGRVGVVERVDVG